MSEVCPNVATEPILQPVTNERFFYCSANTETGARLDVRAQGFRGIYHQQAYFDVRVFNPLATSNRQSAIYTCFQSHDRENIKFMSNVCVMWSEALLPSLSSLPLVV